MTMFQLPAYVELPWYLRPVEQRTIRELCFVGNPWDAPVWFNAWDGRPFVCPWEGATLLIEIYAVYDYGGNSEPGYAGYCPLCGTEFEL